MSIVILLERLPYWFIFIEDSSFGRVDISAQSNLLQGCNSLLNLNLVQKYVSAFKSDNIVIRTQKDIRVLIDEVEEMFTNRQEIAVLDDVVILFLAIS